MEEEAGGISMDNLNIISKREVKNGKYTFTLKRRIKVTPKMLITKQLTPHIEFPFLDENRKITMVRYSSFKLNEKVGEYRLDARSIRFMKRVKVNAN